MTHALNYALRKVLLEGETETEIETINQSGSLVDSQKLRFDFTFKKSLTQNQIAQVEKCVRDIINKRLDVYISEAPLEEAKKINGLKAMFDETYGNQVRVVSLGIPVNQLLENPVNPLWKNTSVELCGGTHIQNTKEAEDFVIIEESSISKGVRRIVAITHETAKKSIEAIRLLEKRIDEIGIYSDEKLNIEFKNIREEINDFFNSNSLPIVEKNILKERFDIIQGRAVEINTFIETNKKNKLKQYMDDEVIKATKENKNFLILEFNSEIEMKSVKNFMSSLTKNSSQIPFFGIGNLEEINVLDSNNNNNDLQYQSVLFSYVPDNIVNQNGLKADEWIKNVVGNFNGGKSGGKITQSQGKIVFKLKNEFNVKQIVDLASSYANKYF
eukprot:c21239_g1_i2.p1 GENE.c21239_g1_i2~~c21239_g1_i2.p1  ORF type:complete len:386 (+),score=159.18 c21239_g1_i2:303-1460(+)